MRENIKTEIFKLFFVIFFLNIFVFSEISTARRVSEVVGLEYFTNNVASIFKINSADAAKYYAALEKAFAGDTASLSSYCRKIAQLGSLLNELKTSQMYLSWIMADISALPEYILPLDKEAPESLLDAVIAVAKIRNSHIACFNLLRKIGVATEMEDWFGNTYIRDNFCFAMERIVEVMSKSDLSERHAFDFVNRFFEKAVGDRIKCQRELGRYLLGRYGYYIFPAQEKEINTIKLVSFDWSALLVSINIDAEGVREFLEALKNQKIEAIIVSKGEPDLISAKLREFGLESYFTSVSHVRSESDPAELGMTKKGFLDQVAKERGFGARNIAHFDDSAPENSYINYSSNVITVNVVAKDHAAMGFSEFIGEMIESNSIIVSHLGIGANNMLSILKIGSNNP